MRRDILGAQSKSADRGVSPVIGVILMVAITVILATVIGTFVLDIGQKAGKSAPRTSLMVDVDQADSNVTINHKGGDTIDLSQTKVTIGNDSTDMTWTEASNAETFVVGDDVEFNVSNPASTSGLGDPASGFNLVSGNQYDVQVIDTNSRRVIFEATFTV